MTSWRSSFSLPPVRPVPVLEAFYSTLGPGDSLDALSAKSTHTLAGTLSDPMPDQKNLQRIKIHSQFLRAELELLTSSAMIFPVM